MKTFYVILALSSCVGCSRSLSEPKLESAKTEAEPKPPVQAANGTAPAGQNEVPLSPAQLKDLAAVVEGNNEFAFDLYRQLAQKPGNKFFSPYSISTALGMTYAGARGNTAKEMAQTLHFSLDSEKLPPAFGELIRKIQGADKKRQYELAVANSLWGAHGLSLDANFLRITQTNYQGGFQFVNFVGDPTGARRTINGWVEGKTNNKIVDLIPPELITKDTRLVLVNAIYFMADWSVPFPKEFTQSEDFIIPGEPSFKVPMMNKMCDTSYMENDDFQLAQLMYKDNDLSMVVILPRKKDGLAEVEKKLSAKALEQALAQLQGVELHVALPKFKLTEWFALQKELNRLGMKDAFVPGAADFKGMVSGGSLFISEVVHKAFVGVDEKGTEAAAATAVVMHAVGPIIKRLPPVPFRADHPFLFLIRHNATGSVFFVGRVFDPRQN